MKRIYYFAALAAVAGVMTSCSNNEELATNSENPANIESANLGINVGIGNSSTGVTSRAANMYVDESGNSRTTFESGKEIGVSLITSSAAVENGGYKYYYKPNASGSTEDPTTYKNIKWTAGSSSWTAASAMPLYNTKAKVTAYYPYNKDGNTTTDPKAIEMKTSDNIDWMYQACTGSTTNKSGSTTEYEDLAATSAQANLTMTHAQAVIKLVINNGNLKADNSAKENLYTGEGKITYVNISSSQFTTDGVLNSMTGVITQKENGTTAIENGSSTGTDKKYDIANDASDEKKTTVKSISDSWFVSPLAEQTDAKVSFEFMIDGQKYTISDVEVKDNSVATKIERNKIYTFTFKLSDVNLSLGTVSITAWSAGGANDSGQSITPSN